MSIKNIDFSSRSFHSKAAKNQPYTVGFEALVQKHLLAKPASPKEAEHYFAKLNKNASISSAQRDFLKIRSITKLVIQLADGMEGVDRNTVGQVLMGMKGKYMRPLDYIRDLKKFLPKVLASQLEMLETSKAIESVYLNAKTG